MKVSDFKVGQTAYVLDCSYRKSGISKCTVKTVGRKYVTVTSGGISTYKFEENDCYPNALSEVTEYGSADLLFPSKEGIERYEETRKLRRWFSAEATSFVKVNSYSLEQLRAVKEILEGGVEND